MPARRAVALCCFVVVIATRLFAQEPPDFTGTWAGTLNGQKTCQNGVVVQLSSPTSAALTQSGGSVTGPVMVIAQILNDQCMIQGTSPVSIAINAGVSGGSFSQTAQVSGDTILVSGTLSGVSMTMTVTDQTENFTLTGTLNRTTAGDLTGDYTGTWSGTIVPCGRLAPVNYGGTLTATFIQTGATLAGTAILVGGKSDHDDGAGNCTLVDDPPLTLSFTGQISGSSITGTGTGQNGKLHTFTGTISGTTITATSPGDFPGESLTVTFIKSTGGGTGGPPAIQSFTASPSSIATGASSTLQWSTTNATSVSIDNGIGSVATSGTKSVTPSKTTTYTLTATGSGGTTTAQTTVTVGSGGPRVALTTLPSGMLEATGETGATDSFTLANVGDSPANVSVSPAGSFFDVSPTSFTIAANSSQSVTIIANAQNAGTYNGTIAVTGDSIPSPILVPVRLLVASPPAGSVNPQPAVARVDLSAPSGQNPSGSVSFTNSGSSALTGMAVSDVPWIVPQSGAITIAPGQTSTVSFNTDRSKRPDGSAPSGGATGTITLRFLINAVTAHAFPSGTTPSSGVSVTIVDVVKPGVAAGSPPPLGNGELAMFIAGHGSAAGIAGDLLFGNRSGSPIPDLKLFLTSQSQFATLPQLAANAAFTLPSVSTSVFGIEAGGSMMLRGSVDKLASAALRMTNPDGARAFFSAIPVFRSDRGVGPGGRIVLSGVERGATRRTTVIVQEVSGNLATADLQGYDSNGTPIGPKTSISINGFLANNSQDTVVEGAQSVVITNTSQGSARLNAYARVNDPSTNDAWIIVDPNANSGASDALIMPMVSSAMAGQTDVYVTNGSLSQTTATLNVVTPSTRRRAIKLASVGDSASESTLTIRSLETQRSTITPQAGYIRITGTPGSISASGRVTMTSNGTFGSALPVLPASAAIGSGDVKRFAGVGDASRKTFAAGTAGSFRSSLLLIETTGQSATVRVTLWYTFSAGVAISSQTAASKEFTVAGNQMLVISDLARTVIGSQRDALGDLRDMQVDVEVTGGSGRVLPFIESIDSSTGDPVVRSE